MATVSPSGSRAGLITALVIFVILFLVSGVLFVTKNSELTRIQNENSQLKQQYETVISGAELAALDKEAEDARSKPGVYAGRTLYDILRAQRGQLAQAITGQPGSTTEEALKTEQAAVAAANKQLEGAKVVVPAAPVTAAIRQLTEAILARETQKATLDTQITDLNGQLAKLRADTDAQMKQFKDAIAAAENKATAAGTAQEGYRTDKDKTIAQLEESMKQKEEASHKAAEELNAQLASRTQENAKLKKDIEKLVHELTKYRPTDVASSMIRRVDGKIIQINANNVVYIDLGQGDQVTPGMTFQIYDKGEGIPRTGGGTAEDELPPGKGALEVVRVGPRSSECRIIKLNSGAINANSQLPPERLPSAEDRVQEGDLIANAVYDRNTKFRFFVYGSFDLDRDKKATPAEAEMIKRLVVQFGGIVVDKIDVDTDFVIMGKEPVVPDVKPDDQVSKFEHDKAMEELKKYEDVRERATGLFIPILNQNRFLFMIGYYDQAPRQIP